MARGRSQVIDQKPLVLDANILIRGAYGMQVRRLIREYANLVSLYTAEICFDDARRHISRLAALRGAAVTPGLDFLDEMSQIVQRVPNTAFAAHELTARSRIGVRDPDDWPVLAAALQLDCPLWTEDFDFFGCGVATWNTHNVEIYLRGD